jgi:hypothetical protein
VFGSTAMGVCLRDSDVDLNLWLPVRRPAVFLRLRKALLQRDPPVTCTVKRGALVPVAQFTVRGVAFDVTHQCGAPTDPTAEPTHSRCVTEWARCWLHADDGLASVVRVLKMWARRRHLDRSFVGYLPSLAYLVLLCYVLRMRCVDVWARTSHEQGGISKSERGRLEPADQMRVLVEFFRFYGVHWQPSRQEIVGGYPPDTLARPAWSLLAAAAGEAGVRHARRSDGGARLRSVGLETVARIQDPVDPNVNLARFLTYRTLEKLREAMRDAHTILTHATRMEDLQQLFG